MNKAVATAFEVLTGPAAVAAAAEAALGCFQLPPWTRAVACARGRAHAFVAVRARRAGDPPALLVGAVHRRCGLWVFESSPMGGYGGWYCPQTLALDDELRLNCQWLSRSPWALVELTCPPGREATLPAPSRQGWWPRPLRERLAPRVFSSHMLDLSGDDADLLARVRPRMRTYLRKFDHLGFVFERAHDREALQLQHDWYCRGSLQWQLPAAALLPPAFFAALEQAGFADVWTVRFEGRVVGAALFLVGAREVQYQASGTERIAAPVSVMEAVIWAAARHYRQQGMSSLNLGASEGLESVARFKEKFGARVTTYRRTTYLLPRLLEPSAAQQRSTEPR